MIIAYKKYWLERVRFWRSSRFQVPVCGDINRGSGYQDSGLRNFERLLYMARWFWFRFWASATQASGQSCY